MSPFLPRQNPEEPTAAQKIVAFKEAFWKFLRPHTIRGTILGSTAVTTIALLENTGVSCFLYMSLYVYYLVCWRTRG